jgi:hypothetical protein
MPGQSKNKVGTNTLLKQHVLNDNVALGLGVVQSTAVLGGELELQLGTCVVAQDTATSSISLGLTSQISKCERREKARGRCPQKGPYRSKITNVVAAPVVVLGIKETISVVAVIVRLVKAVVGPAHVVHVDIGSGKHLARNEHDHANTRNGIVPHTTAPQLPVAVAPLPSAAGKINFSTSMPSSFILGQ